MISGSSEHIIKNNYEKVKRFFVKFMNPLNFFEFIKITKSIKQSNKFYVVNYKDTVSK